MSQQGINAMRKINITVKSVILSCAMIVVFNCAAPMKSTIPFNQDVGRFSELSEEDIIIVNTLDGIVHEGYYLNYIESDSSLVIRSIKSENRDTTIIIVGDIYSIEKRIKPKMSKAGRLVVGFSFILFAVVAWGLSQGALAFE